MNSMKRVINCWVGDRVEELMDIVDLFSDEICEPFCHSQNARTRCGQAKPGKQKHCIYPISKIVFPIAENDLGFFAFPWFVGAVPQ